MKKLLIILLLIPLTCFSQTIKTDSTFWIFYPTDTILVEWNYVEDTTSFKYLYVDDNGFVKLGEGVFIRKTECLPDNSLFGYPYEYKYFIKKDNMWIQCEPTEYQFMIPMGKMP